MHSETIRYLIVPGWQGSAEEHWQSHWHRSLPNAARVEQADWLQPERIAWVTELQRSIASDPRPIVLIAHSLGCITVAHWATQAPRELLQRVRGALLVAPADVERAHCPPALQNFAPINRQPLPFPSLVIGSDNDCAASALRAQEMADNWGSEATILSGVGHINVQSGHQQWQQGFDYLYRLHNRIDRHAQRSA